LEELKALSLTYSSVTPPSFQPNYYWSGTEDPANSANAYSVLISNGSVGSSPKTSGPSVRCVH